ncbi:MAG TPA: hypothetical protein VMU12_02725 [Candidatus Paceibacterota bacterium]|nr:hypothetical protein [Candidatus Paceibacterota bacterium]
MRRDLMQKAVESVLPPIEFGPTGPAVTKPSQGRQTKTTILAFHYADGIMCAADRKTTGYGFHIISQESVKIYQVSAASLMLGCGYVGQIQLIRDKLESRCESWQRAYELPLSIYAQAKFIAAWCRWLAMFTYDFQFGALITGMDPDGSFKLYEVAEDGSQIRFDHYQASGSGGYEATVILDKAYKPTMDEKAAQRLAVEAIFHAANRDSGSSPIQVALPTIVTITKAGVKRIPDAQVMSEVAQVLMDKMGIHVDLAQAIVNEQQKRRRV